MAVVVVSTVAALPLFYHVYIYLVSILRVNMPMAYYGSYPFSPSPIFVCCWYPDHRALQSIIAPVNIPRHPVHIAQDPCFARVCHKYWRSESFRLCFPILFGHVFQFLFAQLAPVFYDYVCPSSFDNEQYFIIRYAILVRQPVCIF